VSLGTVGIARSLDHHRRLSTINPHKYDAGRVMMIEAKFPNLIQCFSIKCCASMTVMELIHADMSILEFRINLESELEVRVD
jgi:hypothetical protein